MSRHFASSCQQERFCDLACKCWFSWNSRISNIAVKCWQGVFSKKSFDKLVSSQFRFTRDWQEKVPTPSDFLIWYGSYILISKARKHHIANMLTLTIASCWFLRFQNENTSFNYPCQSQLFTSRWLTVLPPGTWPNARHLDSISTENSQMWNCHFKGYYTLSSSN